jgi:membrane protease YdiL (CAAX protease family)
LFIIPSVRPSARSALGLIVFIALAYGADKSEHFILPTTIYFLREHLHLNFHATFGPLPAVPVNTLSTIVLVRATYVLIITWIVLKIDGTSWHQAGFSKRRAFRHYGYGLITGFVAITIIMGLLWISDSLIFDGLRLHSSQMASYGLRWLLGLLMVGIAEEVVDRGYALTSIARIFGVLPAVVVTSLVFAFGHAGNPGENPLGLLQVFLFGAVAALSVFRTGSLWWAVAFHGMWDWAQEFLYGTLGSGYWYDGHLLQFRPQGKEFASGGTDGPEGSVFAFLVLAALLAYEINWRYGQLDSS